MGESIKGIDMIVGAELARGDKKDDYYEVAVSAIDDESLRNALLGLSEEDRKGLDAVLDREGMSFGAFKGCDDSEAVVGMLAEWQAAEGKAKKKAGNALLALLQ